MNFLGKYSNGWGHLVVTIASLAFFLVLLLASSDVSIKSLAISMTTLLIGYWFGAGSAGKRKEPESSKDEQ